MKKACEGTEQSLAYGKYSIFAKGFSKMEKTCTLKSNPSQVNLLGDEWYNGELSLMARFGPLEKRKLSGIKCVGETKRNTACEGTSSETTNFL